MVTRQASQELTPPLLINQAAKNNYWLISCYGLIYAGQALIVGILLSRYHVPIDTVGDFWAAIATIVFLANICSISSDRFIAVQLQRLKKYFLLSFKSNLVSIFKFFFILFSAITLMALLLDSLALLLFHAIPKFSESRYSHPVELCVFCIVFFMTTNFMAAFLQTEGYQNQVMLVAIITNLFRIVVIYLILKYNLYFTTSISLGYDLVFTLCVVISVTELIKILGYGYYIYYYMLRISAYNQRELDQQWKKDIWHYALFSLQYDWFLIATIIVEKFGNLESDPAIFGYLFGVVRLFTLSGKVIQQATRDQLVRATLISRQLISYLQQLLIYFGGGVAVTLGILLFLAPTITNYYKISAYTHDLRVLITLAAIKTLAETLFVIVIFAYSNKAMRLYIYVISLIYVAFLCEMIKSSQLSLDAALDTFIHCYFYLTIFEVAMGSLILYSFIQTNGQAQPIPKR